MYSVVPRLRVAFSPCSRWGSLSNLRTCLNRCRRGSRPSMTLVPAAARRSEFANCARESKPRRPNCASCAHCGARSTNSGSPTDHSVRDWRAKKNIFSYRRYDRLFLMMIVTLLNIFSFGLPSRHSCRLDVDPSALQREGEGTEYGGGPGGGSNAAVGTVQRSGSPRPGSSGKQSLLCSASP